MTVISTDVYAGSTKRKAAVVAHRPTVATCRPMNAMRLYAIQTLLLFCLESLFDLLCL